MICNPTSGGGAYDPDEIRGELDGMEIDWIETEGPEDVVEAARDWHEGLLIVAGGDGTINDAVNGLGRSGFPEGVTLGILPAGTGNDLAATLRYRRMRIWRRTCSGRTGFAPSTWRGCARRASGSSSLSTWRPGGLGGDLRRERGGVEGAVGQALLFAGFA